MKSLAIATALLTATTAFASSPMVRVIGARSASVITIDNNGVAAQVSLAQIAVPPAENDAAVAWLNRTLTGSWVMIETDQSGRSYLYRSPDGLYINGELARRAYASDGVRMTYLGESNPAPQRALKTLPVAVRADRLPTPRPVHIRPRLPKMPKAN